MPPMVLTVVRLIIQLPTMMVTALKQLSEEIIIDKVRIIIVVI